jgi:hypothetical protein
LQRLSHEEKSSVPTATQNVAMGTRLRDEELSHRWQRPHASDDIAILK